MVDRRIAELRAVVREMQTAVGLVRERTPHLPQSMEAADAVERWWKRLAVLDDETLAEPSRPHNLTWNGTEWVAPCGCRYHPDDDNGSHGGAPHVHLCAEHLAAAERPARSEEYDGEMGELRGPTPPTPQQIRAQLDELLTGTIARSEPAAGGDVLARMLREGAEDLRLMVGRDRSALLIETACRRAIEVAEDVAERLEHRAARIGEPAACTTEPGLVFSEPPDGWSIGEGGCVTDGEVTLALANDGTLSIDGYVTDETGNVSIPLAAIESVAHRKFKKAPYRFSGKEQHLHELISKIRACAQVFGQVDGPDAIALCDLFVATSDAPPSDPDWKLTAPTYQVIAAWLDEYLPKIRTAARQKGYAVAVHGSLNRDVDLIAVPWVTDAASADDLALAIRDAMAPAGFACRTDGTEQRSERPHGRVSWSIGSPNLWGSYVDLSVMSTRAPSDAPSLRSEPELFRDRVVEADNELSSAARELGLEELARCDGAIADGIRILADALLQGRAPIPMLLHCPECGTRHVDKGEFATKNHHTHACQNCGMTWRPAIGPTVGVQFLPGFKDEIAVESDAREQRFAELDELSQRVGGGCKCNPKPAVQRFKIKLSSGFADLVVPTRLSPVDLTIIRGIVDLIAIVPSLEDERYVSAVEAACERGEVRDSTEVGDGPDP